MKRTVHTETIRAAHAYTRADAPWIIDDVPKSGVCARLMHFISGGGMRTFGRTVRQEAARRRHRRFFIWSGAFGIVWALFYFL